MVAHTPTPRRTHVITDSANEGSGSTTIACNYFGEWI